VSVSEPPDSKKNAVEITDTGFVPGTLRIKAGDVVTFVSKATAPVWPAGNPHPTHDEYPSDAYVLRGDQAKSFGSKACVEYGTRKGDVFDPCKMLLPEQTFSFRFNKKGSWSFHNHVKPEHAGTIIVE
jgi:plastocyanin